MAKNDSIKLKKMAMLKRATKTSTNSNKIYLNKYKYLISQWNSISFSFVRSPANTKWEEQQKLVRGHMICSFDGKERWIFGIGQWLSWTWCVCVCTVRLQTSRKGWRPKKGSRAANETKQPISPNLNSICPSLLLNDTNSAVLMECNYFNPIKCRLSFWSDAVALRKRHDHVRRHLMRNRSVEDAYAAILSANGKYTSKARREKRMLQRKWAKNEKNKMRERQETHWGK